MGETVVRELTLCKQTVDQNEARLLGLRRGAPLLAVARTAWDAEGRAFERSHDLFRADRARIVVRARAAPAAPTLVGASVHVM